MYIAEVECFVQTEVIIGMIENAGFRLPAPIRMHYFEKQITAGRCVTICRFEITGYFERNQLYCSNKLMIFDFPLAKKVFAKSGMFNFIFHFPWLFNCNSLDCFLYVKMLSLDSMYKYTERTKTIYRPLGKVKSSQVKQRLGKMHNRCLRKVKWVER